MCQLHLGTNHHVEVALLYYHESMPLGKHGSQPRSFRDLEPMASMTPCSRRREREERALHSFRGLQAAAILTHNVTLSIEHCPDP